LAAKRKTKHYYSAHNIAIRVSFSKQASVHDGDHDNVDSRETKGFIILPPRWCFCTTIISLCHCTTVIMTM